MLSVVLKILSIAGILLLCLAGLAILLLLLVLFFPVSYKLTGRRDTEQLTVSARASWLFGLLRISYEHPEPGRLLVKILPFTVFDSGKAAAAKGKKSADGSKGNAKKRKGQKAGAEPGQTAGTEQKTGAEPGQTAGTERKTGAEPGQTAGTERKTGAEPGQTAGPEQEQSRAAGREPEKAAVQAQEAPPCQGSEADTSQEQTSAGERISKEFYILKKFRKIKYTICSIYDKIKNIWENISYYVELLQEEETRQLFSHVIFRLGKVWKSIRPRHIRGKLLFGTGAPDTTGYAYGVYGMLSPFLGSSLLVTPDFTRAVLEGDICISGHITLVTILWNGLKVLLDKKLRSFVKKMKAGRKK